MSKNAKNKAASLSFWSGPVAPEPLGGGITNTNFVVRDHGESFVVRIGDDIPLHGVMRFNEIAAARAAHAAGISPEVVYDEPGAFVMRFIKGRTLTEKDMRHPSILERVVPLIRTCHTEIPKYFRGPALVFWPFHICRNYIQIALEGNSPKKEILSRFRDINDKLEKTVGKIELVFTHNDLLAANFIDDGTRLWLFDWDYAGYNAALFDLANIASNNQFSSDQEDWLLSAYYRQTVTDQLRWRLSAMKCMSLLRETLWSIVSEIHSTLNFDYKAYTEENLARFNRAFEAFQLMTGGNASFTL